MVVDTAVSYAFYYGSTNDTVVTVRKVNSSFNLHLALQDTSTAAENKQISVVHNAEWY